MGGQGTVAITQGSFNPGEDNFAKAFTERMNEKYPNIKVLPPQEEGFDPAPAIARAVAILQANPDVTAALSTTGGGPVTWAGAQEETGRKLVMTLGPDMSRPNMDLVRDGKITALGAQPGWETHALAVDLLALHLCGETVPYSNELPTPIVFADGLAPYYEIADRIDARTK
jgi:ribose transport system substrate-binding protein